MLLLMKLFHWHPVIALNYKKGDGIGIWEIRKHFLEGNYGEEKFYGLNTQ